MCDSATLLLSIENLIELYMEIILRGPITTVTERGNWDMSHRDNVLTTADPLHTKDLKLTNEEERRSGARRRGYICVT